MYQLGVGGRKQKNINEIFALLAQNLFEVILAGDEVIQWTSV